jgi:hypothetical protein
MKEDEDGYPYVFRFDHRPSIDRGGDEIEVGRGRRIKAFMDRASAITAVMTIKAGEQDIPNVGLVADEAHALGRQLCRWARAEKRFQFFMRVKGALQL